MKIELDDLIGMGEIADEFGVSPNRVRTMKFRGQLVPVKELRMGPLFRRSQVARILGAVKS